MSVAMIGPKFYAWDRNGKPLAFGKLYTYQARTNYPKATYNTEDQITENTNPIILNGEGYADVYLDGAYKMVLKDKNDTEIWTSDPVTSNQASEWVNCRSAEYDSPTSFILAGNVADAYEAGRVVRISAGISSYTFGTIESSSYVSGETTVKLTESVVTTGIDTVCVSIVGPNSSRITSDKRYQATFSCVSKMKAGNTNDGGFLSSSLIDQADIIVETISYHDGWGAELIPSGGATYTLTLISNVRTAKSDATWEPDGFSDHYLFGGTEYVAMLNDSELVSDKFGCKAGVDCSDNLQALVVKVQAERKIGFISSFKHEISRAIDFIADYGWGLVGLSTTDSLIMQSGSNIPIFNIGATNSGNHPHSVVLENLAFDYTTSQAGKLNANPIYIKVSGSQWRWNGLRFLGGHYAVAQAAGQVIPWGCDWDNLVFGSGLRGGAFNFTGSVAGCPNNNWGRFFVTATNMTDTIFKTIRGYNFKLTLLEMLDANNISFVTMDAGTRLEIEQMKLEIGRYSGAPVMEANSILNLSTNSNIKIGDLHLGGTNLEFLFTSARYLFGGAVEKLSIGNIYIKPTVQPTNFYLFGTTGKTDVGFIKNDSAFTLDWHNNGSSTSATTLTVADMINTRITDNLGDANYSYPLFGATTAIFETALTAARTVSLGTLENQWFNGLEYTVISKGAVNGANKLSVIAEGIEVASLTADNTYVTLRWRRHASGWPGWVVVAKGSIV